MDLEHRAGLTVAELIDILSHHPADAIVEMAIVATPEPGDDDITVDRYFVDGVMPWRDREGDGDDIDDDDEVVWLIGGELDDVEQFIDAVEQSAP
jgi:hypothetical protein